MMKAGARTAITLFCGAAMLFSAVGCGGGDVAMSASRTMTTPSYSVTPAHPAPVTRGAHTGDGSIASLGCIIGLNCGCVRNITCGKRLVQSPPPPTPQDSEVRGEDLMMP